MNSYENIGSFIKENQALVREYVETRVEIMRLRLIGTTSKIAGNLIWIIISLFLFFLLMVFLGIVLGLWLSKITGSYIAGFGITSFVFLLIMVLAALFRKAWFINPFIKTFINHSSEFGGGDEV